MTSPDRPDPPLGHELELVHFIPGRLRLRFGRMKGNHLLAERVESEISAVDGVELVEASHLTGSVLIRYNERIQWEGLLSIADKLNLLPEGVSKANLIRMWQVYALQSR